MGALLSSYHTMGNTSFPEKTIAFYLKKEGFDVKTNISMLDITTKLNFMCKKKDLDIYFEVNDKKIAIEYDGYRFHTNNVDNDIIKNEICKKNNITMLRIREPLLTTLDNISYDYILKTKKTEDLEQALLFIQDFLNRILNIKCKFDINIKRDYAYILGEMNLGKCYNSIAFVLPELLAEWDYDKNIISPECVTFRSHKLIWWKCKEGHSWQARPLNRANNNGCPYCANRKLLKGFNDFKTLYPNLIKYWDKEKNILKPTEILGKSNQEIWWKCPYCKNSFKMKVFKFVNKNIKCCK